MNYGKIVALPIGAFLIITAPIACNTTGSTIPTIDTSEAKTTLQTVQTLQTIPTVTQSVTQTNLPSKETQHIGVPTVVNTTPKANEWSGSGDHIIKIFFSEPMDENATAAAFSVKSATNDQLNTTITWGENAQMMVVTFSKEFALNIQYTVTITQQARSAVGVNMKEDFIYWFFGPFEC